MPAWCSINQRTARARRPAVVGRGLSEGLGLSVRMLRANLTEPASHSVYDEVALSTLNHCGPWLEKRAVSFAHKSFICVL